MILKLLFHKNNNLENINQKHHHSERQKNRTSHEKKDKLNKHNKTINAKKIVQY